MLLKLNTIYCHQDNHHQKDNVNKQAKRLKSIHSPNLSIYTIGVCNHLWDVVAISLIVFLTALQLSKFQKD